MKRSREGEMFHVKQEEGGVPVFGGGLPSLPPAAPAFSLLFCPHPPAPLPSGKGEIFSFLMQGASPLASPALNRLRHLLALPLWCPAGGRAPALPVRRALAAP